jgi:transglutaminase-like putative cysteine protease
MHLSTVETVLEYQVESPTHFCFNIEAAHWPTQKILGERLAISSGVAHHSYTDPRSGNRFIRFDAQPGPLMVNYKAEVEVHSLPRDTSLRETPVGQVPDGVLPYLLATRYCESDVLCGEVVRMFGELPPGHARVRAIEEWIRREIRYEAGSTNSNTTAQEVSRSAPASAAISPTWASPSAAPSTSRRASSWAMSGSTSRRRISTPCSRPGWMATGCCSIPPAWRRSTGWCA